MDDFHLQLRQIVDDMVAAGVPPTFLIIDMEGSDHIKKTHGQEALDGFKEAAIRAVSSATHGADAFTQGDDRLVVVLGNDYDRLKTFSLIKRLRGVIPLLSQSFDLFLDPQFDVVEYDEAKGLGALMVELSTRHRPEVA